MLLFASSQVFKLVYSTYSTSIYVELFQGILRLICLTST